MGLKIETDMKAFKGKTLMGYSWNPGNEYVVFLDNKGTQERVRIPGYMKDMFEMHWSITMQEDQLAA